jgi:hypothetical protein
MALVEYNGKPQKFHTAEITGYTVYYVIVKKSYINNSISFASNSTGNQKCTFMVKFGNNSIIFHQSHLPAQYAFG